MISNKLLASMRKKQDLRRRLWDNMSTIYDVGVEVPGYSAASLVDLLGDPDLTQSRVTAYVKTMDEIGLLSRRMEFQKSSATGHTGRKFFLTMLDSRDIGLAKLNELDATEIETANANTQAANKNLSARSRGRKKYVDENGKTRYIRPEMRGNAVTAVRFRDEAPVEAISGPDAPSPFEALRPLRRDEGAALIEAARQYVTRTGGLTSKIEDVIATAKELGISINEDTLRESVGIERDERLETIALVLPYIDALERRVRTIESLSAAGEVSPLAKKANGEDFRSPH